MPEVVNWAMANKWFYPRRAGIALLVAGALVGLVAVVSRQLTDSLSEGVLQVVGGVLLVLAAVTGLGLILWRGTADATLKPIWLSTDGDTRRSAFLRWATLGLSLLAVLCFAPGASLDGDTSIVRLELAASADAAKGLRLDSAEVYAALLGDVPFIASYALLLFLLTHWAGSYYRIELIRNARTPLSYAVVFAAVADGVENLMIWLGVELGSRDWPWLVSATASWSKFTVLVLVIGYVLGGVHAWLATPVEIRRIAWTLASEAAPARERESTDGRELGLALAGGGIRAASISLGAMQVLEGEGAPIGGLGWSAARAVTAVSGGSNMAAGWSLARSTYEPDGAGATDRTSPTVLSPQPWAQVPGGTPEERHLLSNLGYLASNAPRGAASDPAVMSMAETDPGAAEYALTASYRPTAYATIFVGMALNALVILSALFVVSRTAGWALRALAGHDIVSGDDKRDMHAVVAAFHLGVPGPAIAAIGVLVLVVWVVLGQSLLREATTSKWRRNVLSSAKWGAYGGLGLGAILMLVLWAIPELAGFAAKLNLSQTSVTALGTGAGVLATVVRVLRKPAARFAPMIGGVVFVGLLAFLGCAWMADAAEAPPTWALFKANSVTWWLAALVFLVILQLLKSPERWALAAFYRGKLRLAYATFRDADKPGQVRVYQNDNGTSDPQEREPHLHAFTPRAPRALIDPAPGPGVISTPLVVCATSTVSSRAVRTHYGIPALSVTFDPERVTVHVPEGDEGIWGEYSASTRLINELGKGQGKRLTTLLAVAISSAAVSPAMGRFRVGPTSMLLAFANLRLGVWMPNPRYAARLEGEGIPAGAPAPDLTYPRTGLSYLAKEFFGFHDTTDPFLYMTDGGHWENTGLVELLRRKDIHEVIAIDADSGAGDAASSLSKALDLAPLETGVRVHINLDPLRAKLSGSNAPSYAERTVNLGIFKQGEGDYAPGDDLGVLWYSKPGLSLDMPDTLLAFRETHADYPFVSTMNQFFDTSTFVAYRGLGRFNGEVILGARAALVELLEGLLAGAPTPAGLRTTLAGLAEAPEEHWVVGEFARALSRLGSAAPLEFCRAVQKVLAETETNAAAGAGG